MSIEVKHHKNGNINSIEIKNEKGDLHNTEGPAIQAWYENGQRACRGYFVNGHHHNSEGPAFQEWHLNGQEYYRVYWVNGHRHSTEGPAVQVRHEDGQEQYEIYYIHGEKLTKKEWEKKVNSVTIECEGKTVTISRESAKALNLI